MATFNNQINVVDAKKEIEIIGHALDVMREEEKKIVNRSEELKSLEIKCEETRLKLNELHEKELNKEAENHILEINLENTNKSIEQKAQMLRDIIKAIDEQHKIFEENIIKLKNEKDELKQLEDKQGKEMEAHQTRQEQILAEIQALSGQLGLLPDQKHELQKEIDKYQKLLDALRNEYTEAKQEYEFLKSENIKADQSLEIKFTKLL